MLWISYFSDNYLARAFRGSSQCLFRESYMGLCWHPGKISFLSMSPLIYYNQYFQNRKKEILSGAMVMVISYVFDQYFTWEQECLKDSMDTNNPL